MTAEPLRPSLPAGRPVDAQVHKLRRPNPGPHPGQTRPTRADSSPFTTVEAQFTALSDAGMLALDADLVGRAGSQPVPLRVLRDMLLNPSVSYDQRDRILDLVLARARDRPDPWLLGVAGLLLPGLRRVRDDIERTFSLLRRHPDVQNELQAELLTALMEAARTRAPGKPKVAHALLRVAAAAGRRYARADNAATRNHTNIDEAFADPATVGYDDTIRPPGPRGPVDVLQDAVDAHVLHADDAWLIAASRLDRQRLPALAEQLGLGYHTLRKRRERAEAHLAAWLKGNSPTSTAHGGRPRHPSRDTTTS